MVVLDIMAVERNEIKIKPEAYQEDRDPVRQPPDYGADDRK
jgi:hypothetical protein